VVSFRPLQICTTTEAHDYKTIGEAAFLYQEGELPAFEVVLPPFVRVKIELDAPEQPDGMAQVFRRDSLENGRGLTLLLGCQTSLGQ